MATKAITSSNFDAIIAGDKPVLVDFWATWCGPCRALGPVVEDVSNELADKMDVYKCDVDKEPDLAVRFNIVSIPTLILFKGGTIAHKMVGSMSRAALLNEVTSKL